MGSANALQPVRLWPKASLPLDASLSYIVLLPSSSLAAAPSAGSQANEHQAYPPSPSSSASAGAAPASQQTPPSVIRSNPSATAPTANCVSALPPSASLLRVAREDTFTSRSLDSLRLGSIVSVASGSDSSADASANPGCDFSQRTSRLDRVRETFRAQSVDNRATSPLPCHYSPAAGPVPSNDMARSTALQKPTSSNAETRETRQSCADALDSTVGPSAPSAPLAAWTTGSRVCCERELSAGTLALVHGAAARENTRAQAKARFDELIADPSRIHDHLPPCVGHEAPLLCAHLGLVATAAGTDPRKPTGLASSNPCQNSGTDGMLQQQRSAPSSVGPRDRPVTGSRPPSCERPSRSMSALPLLDFGQLPDIAAVSTAQICSARRKVDSIVAALSRVRPYLYVTGVHGIQDLSRLRGAGITHVLNLAGFTSSNFHEHDKSITYKCMCPRDDIDEDLSVLFDDVAAFIDSARVTGGVVAVHCHMGVSRGCAIAAAYLMMDEGLTHQEALQHVRDARPVSEPNSSFVRSLAQLERRIRHGREETILFRVQPFRKNRDPHYLVAVPMDCESMGLCGRTEVVPKYDIIETNYSHDADRKRRELEAELQSVSTPGQRLVLDDRFGWILALSARGGVHALCGHNLSEEAWQRTKEMAFQMARQEERYELMFPQPLEYRSSSPIDLCESLALHCDMTEASHLKAHCPVRYWTRTQWRDGAKRVSDLLVSAWQNILGSNQKMMMNEESPEGCAMFGNRGRCSRSLCAHCCLPRRRASYMNDPISVLSPTVSSPGASTLPSSVLITEACAPNLPSTSLDSLGDVNGFC